MPVDAKRCDSRRGRTRGRRSTGGRRARRAASGLNAAPADLGEDLVLGVSVATPTDAESQVLRQPYVRAFAIDIRADQGATEHVAIGRLQAVLELERKVARRK